MKNGKIAVNYLIFSILFSLSLVAQETGIPYVQTSKIGGSSNDFTSFVLNGEALLFEENEHLHLWSFSDFALNQCLTAEQLNNYKTTWVQLKGRETIPVYRWINELTATSGTMFLSFDDRVELWDIKTWKKINEFETPVYDKWGNRENFDILMVDDKAHKLIAGSNKRNLYLYDLPSMTLLQKFRGSDIGLDEFDFPVPLNPYLKGHECQISYISKIIDDHYFFSASYGDKSLRKWDIRTGEEVSSLQDVEFRPYMQLTKDNRTLILNKSREEIIRLDASDLQPIQKFTLPNTLLSSFVIDQERQILFASAPKDKLIIEYDMKTGQEIRRTAMLRSAGSLIISPNTRYIGGQRGNMLTFWNLSNYKETIVLYPINNCDWVAITPEGYFNASDDAISSIRIQDANGTDRALTPEEITKYKQPQKIQEILNDIISTNKMAALFGEQENKEQGVR